MKFIFVCIFVTLAAASRNHHHHHLVVLNAEASNQLFGEQDINGYYTISHNVEESPKAEPQETSDNLNVGQEQSDAEANIVDFNCAPEPVTDTPEVDKARQAHFDAYREAALMAALAPDTDVTATGSSENNVNDEQLTDLQQNTRELLLNKQNFRQQLTALRRANVQERVGQEIGQQQQNQLITTYILTAKAEAHAHASGQVQAHAQIEHPNRAEYRTIYSLESDELNREAESNGNGNSNGNGSETSNDKNGNGHRNGNGNGNGHKNNNGNGVTNGNGDGVTNANGNGVTNGNGNGHHNNGNGLTNGNGNGHHNNGNGVTNGNGNGHKNNGNGVTNGNGHKNNGNGNGVSNANGNGHTNGNANENGVSNVNGNSNANSNSIDINNGLQHIALDNVHINSNENGHLHSLLLDESLGFNNANADTTYYTVNTPDTHYTVVIPSVLTTQPRIESIHLGDPEETAALPLAKSFTYITQRLKSSTD